MTRGTEAVQPSSNGIAGPLATSGGLMQVPTPNHTAQQRPSGQGDTSSGFPQVVASSPGLPQDARSQGESCDFMLPVSLEWQRNGTQPPQLASCHYDYDAYPGLSGVPQTTTP